MTKHSIVVSRAPLFIAAVLAGACAAGSGSNVSDGAVSDGGSGSGSSTGAGVVGDGGGPTTGGAGGDDGDFGFGPGGTGTGGGSSAGGPPCGGGDPDVDGDGDGWTGAEGDCNDCSAQMNPGALDWPGNGVDEDCSGQADDSPADCDDALDLGSPDALDGARAMGLCKMQQGESWGVVSAEYVTADGQPLANFDGFGLGHGILSGFGPNVHPQEGKKLLALSSGTARQPNDPGYQPVDGCDKNYTTGAPPGFPKESPSCPDVVTGEPHDSAALRVTIRTPTNAKSLRFNLDFYTYEFPKYVCSKYNDFFVALLSPPPSEFPDGNISFDAQGNLISVNAGFLQVCYAQQTGVGKYYPCPLGPSELQGTGFDADPFGYPNSQNSAATGWLETTSPISSPGSEISLLFAIWDSGDGALDSTVLLDNFRFDVQDLGTSTDPIETPK